VLLQCSSAIFFNSEDAVARRKQRFQSMRADQEGSFAYIGAVVALKSERVTSFNQGVLENNYEVTGREDAIFISAIRDLREPRLKDLAA
jgi:hypothetical protein